MGIAVEGDGVGDVEVLGVPLNVTVQGVFCSRPVWTKLTLYVARKIMGGTVTSESATVT